MFFGHFYHNLRNVIKKHKYNVFLESMQIIDEHMKKMIDHQICSFNARYYNISKVEATVGLCVSQMQSILRNA